MKRLPILCLAAVIVLSLLPSLRAQGNPEANKLAREGSEAAKNKDWDGAIESLRKAADMDKKYAPNLAAAFQQRAAEETKANRFPEALGDFEAALKAHPNAGAYEGRAYVYMRMNDVEHALADYSEAIKMNPGEARLYSYRAHMLANKGDFKGALGDADKVLKIKKGDADAQALKKWAEERMKAATTAPPPPPNAPVPPKP